MTMPDGERAYNRGRLDGEVASALARHENHFERMNGSLEKMVVLQTKQAELLAHQAVEFAAQLAVQSLAIQRLADLGDAREKTVKETAAALKVADDQRRDASASAAAMADRPYTRTSLVVGVLVGIAGVAIAVWVATRG